MVIIKSQQTSNLITFQYHIDRCPWLTPLNLTSQYNRVIINGGHNLLDQSVHFFKGAFFLVGD